MKQEPTQAARSAAAGIPVLQGREDVNITNPPLCDTRGRLSPQSFDALQNLAYTAHAVFPSDRDLACRIPATEKHTHHIAYVNTQMLNDSTVEWWASWLDVPVLRDKATLFAAPFCLVVNESIDSGCALPDAPHDVHLWVELL